MKNNTSIASSFRDPSGFVFYRGESLCRQINLCYKEDYDYLINSGLYQSLVSQELLVRHEEIKIDTSESDEVYKIIRPEFIPFISYPYEWSYSQLKDAALTTLKIQKNAFKFGMSLKDCSAYNIQFLRGKPIFIDTLSFEKYKDNDPWVAYRQFCQHFLAPLALMSLTDIRLNQLLRIYIDGVPLDLASSLLPLKSRFRFSLLCHIHLHAKSQKHYENKTVRKNGRKIGRLSFLGLLDSLETAVSRMKWQAKNTEWAEYYNNTNYSQDSLEHKKRIICDFLDEIDATSVWDLGANDGLFSRIASDRGINVVSLDADPSAVENNYLTCIKNGTTNILPLLMDLINPSGGLGWENSERMSLFERCPVDTVFALALIHHLAISNNSPFSRIASFFSRICTNLIIEFVDKSDSQVQRLLCSREDIFHSYTPDIFKEAFTQYFRILDSENIRGTKRTLFLMQRKDLNTL